MSNFVDGCRWCLLTFRVVGGNTIRHDTDIKVIATRLSKSWPCWKNAASFTGSVVLERDLAVVGTDSCRRSKMILNQTKKKTPVKF